MKSLLALAVIIALGAGSAHAKAAYCQDPTTHKRISCKTAGATPEPAATATPANFVRNKPHATVAASGPPATPTAPVKKPSMFAGMMKPKPATPAAPMQSSAAPARTAPTTATLASGSTRAAPHCVKGKACGNSCIKATDVCHKPT